MSGHNGAGEIYLNAAAIGARVAELGVEITADYADSDLVLVGLLKSSVVFLADLCRAIETPHEIDFMELAPYNGEAEGTAASVRLLKDASADVAGRDVLLVEDVVDTGLTLNYLRNLLELRSPRSLAIATLLDRPYRRLVDDLPVRYVGFVVPDEFFVGYGFDLNERGRNFPDLRLRASAPS
ncbi:MAG: hypoxanthine phosphoribosyltransferase [Actinomycetota bacterium]|nr:hypoxanthine phosphoribosyltransferase [Actinomycetota bacterium]